MKYGFIGCGAMAGAILQGGIEGGYLKPSQTFIYEKNGALAKERSDRWIVRAMSSASELIEASDVVIVGVKPASLPDLLPEIGPYLAMNKSLMISIAGGTTLEKLSEMLQVEVPTVRVMPNLNCAIRQGACALCANSLANHSHRQEALRLFSSMGLATELDESLFGAFTAIAGCGPAFVYLFADSLARGAVKLGMGKKQALEIAAATIAGSANSLLRSNEHPWELIDRVCSPGGSTIEGISSLLSSNFEASVMGAVEASASKDAMTGK